MRLADSFDAVADRHPRATWPSPSAVRLTFAEANARVPCHGHRPVTRSRHRRWRPRGDLPFERLLAFRCATSAPTSPTWRGFRCTSATRSRRTPKSWTTSTPALVFFHSYFESSVRVRRASSRTPNSLKMPHRVGGPNMGNRTIGFSIPEFRSATLEDPATTAFLQPTGGTTGRPRAPCLPRTLEMTRPRRGFRFRSRCRPRATW